MNTLLRVSHQVSISAIRNAFCLFAFLFLWLPNAIAEPILQPPPLPNPIIGGRVYNAGAILKNNSAVNAEDVRIGFRIPGSRENINQVSLRFGIGPAVSNVITLGDQFSSIFDQHFQFDGFVIQPGQSLQLSGLIESQRTNALKWNKNAMKLTDAQQHELDTLFYAGSIKVESQSPLTYTFGNDGTETLHIDEIALGWSWSLIDAEAFSRGLLNDLSVFNNAGIGWDLSLDAEIPILVPFDLPIGAFLVADVLGVGDKNGLNELPVHFLQQHESVPEPSTVVLTLSGFALLIATRKVQRNGVKANAESA